MIFQTKHLSMIILLLIASFLLLMFVPNASHYSQPISADNTQQQIEHMSSVKDFDEGRLSAVLVVLAKCAIAIISGVFILFCVCSRLGFCLSRRNKAILASTYTNRISNSD